jgi:MIP family channel proteins
MDRRLTGPLLAECLGTFLFFVVGAGSIVVQAYPGASGGSGLVGVAFAHGLILAVLVSALGAVSGGHFNPAVTFGVWVAGRIENVRAAAYVVAQLVGALAAGLLLRLIFDPALDTTRLGTPALGDAISGNPLAGIVIEAILTMVLLTAVFGTAVDPRAPKIGGLAIGLAVAADILMGGPLTGAAMNPARWFGPAIVSATLDDWYVWWVGPLLGAGIVALLYRQFFLLEADLARTPASPE